MRSFSSIWFWIVLAAVWSMVSHRVLGVPYDMIAAARKQGGQAEQDLEDMVRINVLRRLRMADQAGIWLLGLGCFILTGLVILGWVYRIELAQALFLLGLPLGFTALLSLLTAKRIRAEGPQGEALHRHLLRHRLWVQSIAMTAIFVTALWGMYRALSVGVLGS